MELVAFAATMGELLTKGKSTFVVRHFYYHHCTKDLIHLTTKPMISKYVWVVAEKAEIIFLNYFRWPHEMIALKEFLILLEGQAVHLLSFKNHHSNDICIDKDTP